MSSTFSLHKMVAFRAISSSPLPEVVCRPHHLLSDCCRQRRSLLLARNRSVRYLLRHRRHLRRHQHRIRVRLRCFRRVRNLLHVQA